MCFVSLKTKNVFLSSFDSKHAKPSSRYTPVRSRESVTLFASKNELYTCYGLRPFVRLLSGPPNTFVQNVKGVLRRFSSYPNYLHFWNRRLFPIPVFYLV